jgi:hypothetical protein
MLARVDQRYTILHDLGERLFSCRIFCTRFAIILLSDPGPLNPNSDKKNGNRHVLCYGLASTFACSDAGEVRAAITYALLTDAVRCGPIC